MKEKGFENVRGGSWTKLILTKPKILDQVFEDQEPMVSWEHRLHLWYCYVFRLEHNKFWVGKTDNPNKRLAAVLMAQGSIPKWTRTHKPLEIVRFEIIPQNHDRYEYVSKVTREMMIDKGWENVQGGKYKGQEPNDLTPKTKDQSTQTPL